jgi:hypothetical protein
MNRLVYLFVVGTLSVSAALASTTTCPTGSYSAYLGGSFTCTSGNLTFSGFDYTSSASGTAIPATAVTVTPITTTSNEGFSFQPAGMTVTNTGSTQNFSDILITYVVTDPLGITDIELAFSGSSGGTGLIDPSETYCFNQTTVAGCPSGHGGILNTATLSATFGAVTSIAISKDFSVASGTNGTATLLLINNQYSQSNVPEPLPCALLGSGLAGLILLRRRLLNR